MKVIFDRWQAVKFGYLFGVNRKTLDYDMPSKAAFRKVAEIFEKTFAKCVKETKKVIWRIRSTLLHSKICGDS